MRSYPIPFNEPVRLAAAKNLSFFSSIDDPVLDEIVGMVRKELDVPTALVSIVDQEKQWFAARRGFPVSETTKDYSICAHAIMKAEPLVICDTFADPRFCKHPVVVNDPFIRFYAGVPIVLSSGLRVGSLCALDYVPRDHPSEGAMRSLEGLAQITAAVLDRSQNISVQTIPAAEAEYEAAKSTFLDLIGHELRTPLTVIFGSLKLLEANAECGPSRSLAKTARKSSEHLMRLVETIIDFADASTGELRLNEEKCELREIVTSVAEIRLPGEDNAIRSIALSEELESVSAFVDPDQIRLCLSAVAINAINHGGPDIRIGIRRDPFGNIELWISDNGDLSETASLELFEQPFVVGGDLAQRDTRGGLGLGLPLTRKLIELHGGELKFGTAEGRTIAILRLPAWRGEVG